LAAKTFGLAGGYEASVSEWGSVSAIDRRGFHLLRRRGRIPDILWRQGLPPVKE